MGSQTRYTLLTQRSPRLTPPSPYLKLNQLLRHPELGLSTPPSDIPSQIRYTLLTKRLPKLTPLSLFLKLNQLPTQPPLLEPRLTTQHQRRSTLLTQKSPKLTLLSITNKKVL